MNVQETVEEVINSLTGFEEIGIEKATGQGLEYWTMTGRRLVVTRIMAAVIKARGVADGKPFSEAQIKTAWQEVQGLTQKELVEQFVFEEPEAEVFDEEPVTPQGKDDSPAASGPDSSPGSVSEPE